MGFPELGGLLETVWWSPAVVFRWGEDRSDGLWSRNLQDPRSALRQATCGTRSNSYGSTMCLVHRIW